jgi:hypothetical protein
VVTPISQMLIDNVLPASFLGQDLHATSSAGHVIESMMRCTMGSNYSYARENCGRTSKLGLIAANVEYMTEAAVFSIIGVPIMLNQNSSQLVGFIGGYFQWGKIISALIPDQFSGNYPPPSPYI